MRTSKSLLGLAVAFVSLLMLGMAGGVQPAVAADKDPLFVNLVSDDAHGAAMALRFAKTMKGKGHPVTVFFNNRGVLVASKAHAETYPEQQKTLAELNDAGAVLVACEHCMHYYGMDEKGLASGVAIGTPDLLEKQLFLDGSKSLTW